MITTLVIDVRTSRIIWFAQTEPAEVPQDGEHWIASVQSADVPRNMSLLNCHKYKFVGGKFKLPPDPPVVRVKSILESNKDAAIKALFGKLQNLWNLKTPWHYASLDQREKQQYANAFVDVQTKYVKLILDAQNDNEIDSWLTKISCLSLQNIFANTES